MTQAPLYGRSVADALLEYDVGLVADEGTMREHDRLRDYLRMFRASAAHGAVGDEPADD